MQAVPPDGRSIFRSVSKGKAWLPIFVQLLWVSLAVVACFELPSDAWFLKIAMAFLVIPPIYFFSKTLPFLINGSMTLEIDDVGIVIRKYGRTRAIPWANVKKIGFKSAIVSIGTSNWSYSFIVYRNNDGSSIVALPDAFSVKPKDIYDILLRKQQLYLT